MNTDGSFYQTSARALSRSYTRWSVPTIRAPSRLDVLGSASSEQMASLPTAQNVLVTSRAENDRRSNNRLLTTYNQILVEIN